MRRIIYLLLCCTILICAVSCSSKKETETTTTSLPREVTNKEAQLLSSVLSNNAEDKNASFSIISGSSGSGGFSSKGKVDWANSAVENNISLLDPEQVDLTTVAVEDGVFEKFAGLENAMSNANLEPREWVFRGFDPSVYGTDALSQFIIKLASPAPDNPILLKQNGAKFLGTQKIEGQLTYMFQNTESVTYFLTKEGELKKVTARIKGFPNAIEIIFSERGKTNLEVPSTDDSYSLDRVSSFYSGSRPPF